MKKPKTEIRELMPDLIRADSEVKRLRKRTTRLTETRVRILHDGGKGWAFELASTDLRIEQALAELTDALKMLNSIGARLQR